MHDALTCGRSFRSFDVVDDYNHEALAIEIIPIYLRRAIRGLRFVLFLRNSLCVTNENYIF